MNGMNGTATMNGAAHAAAPAVDLGALPEAPAAVTVKLAYRGHDVMLTLRGMDGRAVLARLDAALTWLEAHGAAAAGASRPSGVAEAAAPTCPTHGRPMRQGKRGGWFCPVKVADDDGAGRPVYCRAKAGGAS